MKWNFEGKKMVITGGASGIGNQIAKDCASSGAAVAIIDLNENVKDHILNELNELSSQDHLFFSGSVSDKAFIDDAFAKIAEKWGDFDSLINCAGILQDFMSYRFDERKWDLVIDVNLKGIAVCTQAAATHWVNQSKAKAQAMGKKYLDILENPPKVIVSISSMVADGNPGQLTYSATKAGIIGMTYTLAKELVNYNIRTHAVKPTLIETPIIGDLLQKEDHKFEKYYKSRIPFGIGKPEYVSDVICFLCSEGGYFLNGCVIPINGGKLDGV